jgi:FkbM family methyltransferase|tara:strand:+ start:674 stop:1342 length:669 start_codon:yes stop_codon:yes gene_type:complete
MFFWSNIKFYIKRKFSTYTALNELDKKIEKYLNYKKGYFIEMGANDGINQSNTRFLEKKYNWRGMLIEPSEKFTLLKKNRSKKNIFSNAACCSFKNRGKSIKFSYYNLMTLALNLKTDINIKKHKLNAKKFSNNSYEFIKKGIPLNDLLSKNNAPKIIDFFSLDVEGVELEVLQGINHKIYKFKYLLIEIRDFKSINSFLIKKNYILLSKLTKKDYLFKYKF